MNRWLKYLLSTIIFGIVYGVMNYIYYKEISWLMILIAVIIYFVLYLVLDIISEKLTKANKKD